MATTISPIFNNSLFKRLLNSKKSNNENTNSGYLNNLEVEKTGYICDNSTGVFKKSDNNSVVLIINTENKTKINLALKESPSANSFVRLCYFNNDTFIRYITSS